jgi:hypothetical protein
MGAAGLVIGRTLAQIALQRAGLGAGVRAAILAFDDVSLAAVWGYGLALSSTEDGRLGGTPFGRYALFTMLLRGAVDTATRGQGALGLSFAIAVGALSLGYALLGVYRLRRAEGGDVEAGQETIREFAREQLRRGGLRPGWVVFGALGNLGGMVLGLVAAVLVGRSARVDFGEIDRSGPAAEYAAMLLVLGVIVSFPISAAIIGMASGGRDQVRPHVLEAGLAAIFALGALLAVLGVVAPVAVALGVACAPVAFVLAGVGAWVAAGRRS